MRLSIDVLFNHLENVVHDLEYRAAVIDVSRFLKMMDAKASITNAVGIPGMKSVNESLKAVASDQGEHLSFADNVLRKFRFRATLAMLSFRAFTLPLDTSGNTINGIKRIGPTRMAAAMKAFVTDPRETVSFVNSKSVRMRSRAQLRDRDISDLARRIRGEKSAYQEYAFYVQVLADEAVGYPLWAEVYRHNLSVKGDETAIQMADEAVTRTLGSGSTLDLVGAQRGSERDKIFSMFYSWASMMFNDFWLDSKMAGVQWGKNERTLAMMTMAKWTLFAWGLQALNENIWREFLRNNGDDEDEEERNRRIMARMIAQPFGYVWIIRDIAGPIIDRATGKSQANYRFSPMESALETIFLDVIGRGGSIAISDDEVDLRYMEDAARAGPS